MIMTRFKVTTIFIAIMVLAAIIGIWHFRPGESPPAESGRGETAAFTAEPAVPGSAFETPADYEARWTAKRIATAESLKTLYRNPGRPGPA
ncbi:MAG: hypothetical protein JW720_01145 [Sedimentisphaerales bacterium]|nr:hypothetical protein [Sedimentisphaerales bacterium]